MKLKNFQTFKYKLSLKNLPYLGDLSTRCEFSNGRITGEALSPSDGLDESHSAIVAAVVNVNRIA